MGTLARSSSRSLFAALLLAGCGDLLGTSQPTPDVFPEPDCSVIGSSQNCWTWRWSRDGEEILYIWPVGLSEDGVPRHELRAIRVSNREERTIAPPFNDHRITMAGGMRVSDTHIYFTAYNADVGTGSGVPYELYRVPAEGGEIELVGERLGFLSYSVSPDGSTIVSERAGHLAPRTAYFFDTSTRTWDSPMDVRTNPSWSPDSRMLVSTTASRNEALCGSVGCLVVGVYDVETRTIVREVALPEDVTTVPSGFGWWEGGGPRFAVLRKPASVVVWDVLDRTETVAHTFDSGSWVSEYMSASMDGRYAVTWWCRNGGQSPFCPPSSLELSVIDLRLGGRTVVDHPTHVVPDTGGLAAWNPIMAPSGCYFARRGHEGIWVGTVPGAC